MKKTIRTRVYNKLIDDISALYDVARHALVEAYWQVGKRIVEEEQQGRANAVYGDYLLDRLSEDLSGKLGSGFSKRNLYKMRQFYLTHPIAPAPAQLSWTQHMELLPVKDKAARRRLENKIVRQELSLQEIRQAVHEVTQANKPPETLAAREFVPKVAPLEYTRRPVHCYSLVDQAKSKHPKGMVVVDCGFNVWRTLSGRERMSLGEASHTYPARVASVIDGDTLWAVIDCGFDTCVREKLRFRGIDAPELGSPEGNKVRQIVTRKLEACPGIVIQTHKTDKYARYLADIFYLPGCHKYERIASQGRFLNQELLDKGLAQPWRS